MGKLTQVPKSSRIRIRTLATSHDQEGCFFLRLVSFHPGLETGVGTEQVRAPPRQLEILLGRVDFSFWTGLPPDPGLEMAGKAKMVAPVAYLLGEVGQVGLSSPMSHSFPIC